MQSYRQTPEEINKRIRELQGQIARNQGFIESQGEMLKQAKEQAASIFGTDDVEQIKLRLAEIREKNARIANFKASALDTIQRCMTCINQRTAIPDELMATLQKIMTAAQNNAAKRLAANADNKEEA